MDFFHNLFRGNNRNHNRNRNQQNQPSQPAPPSHARPRPAASTSSSSSTQQRQRQRQRRTQSQPTPQQQRQRQAQPPPQETEFQVPAEMEQIFHQIFNQSAGIIPEPFREQFAQAAFAQHMHDRMNGSNNAPPQEQQFSPNAPPPASNKAIRTLPIVTVTPEDLVDENNRECCICFDEHKLGDRVVRLPCAHICKCSKYDVYFFYWA